MKITRKQLGKLVRESFWREQQKHVRMEQLPEDAKAAKHMILDIMKQEYTPEHASIFGPTMYMAPELIKLVSETREKDMKMAVNLALKSLVEEGMISWEGGGRAGTWYFLNRDML